MTDESPAERLSTLREQHDLEPAVAEQLADLQQTVADLEQQREQLNRELQQTNAGLLELTAELQEAEQRYRRLFETSAEGIYTVDQDIHTYELVNPAMTDILGYEDQAQLHEAVSHIKTDVFVSPSRYEEYRTQLAETGRLDSFQYQVQTAADTQRWVSDSVVPITNDGTIEGYRGGVIDITERKHHQEQLRLFQQATEAAGSAIFLIDTDGSITYVNPAFEAITGYSADEARGATLSILDSDESEVTFEQLWATVSTDGKWEGQIVNQRKSGEYYHARQTIAPITDETGTIQKFVGVQTDITREIERKRQVKALDRVMRHNLRNNLNVIKGQAELAIEETTEDSVKAAARQIIATTDDLMQTADESREISRLLAATADRERRSLTTLLHDTVTAMRARYPEATIETTLTDATVLAVGAIDRAIEELLENAITHNDDTPHVQVSLTTTAETAQLTITDNGPGIPEFDRHVFEDPARGDELSHGSGLGLWLVYWILHRSGGTIDYEPSTENGSTITVQLPRAEQTDPVSSTNT